MIDIHSHILPGIDDGAKKIEDTMEMLRIASKNGIKKMAATSHFYSGYYENKYIDICKHVEEVNIKAREISLDVEIFPGQEIFLDKHTLKHYENSIIKGINNTKYMLVELPMETMPKDSLDLIYELRIKGVIPIIAHPERYAYIMEKNSIINSFIDEHCLFQINSGSITGIFGKKVQKTSEILISHGICDFIASDAHSTGRRCPSIRAALDIANSINKGIDIRTQENAEKLLSNNNIDKIADKINEKRSIFSFFKRK